ncbi:type II CAAX endopeptidase family protein [Pelagicoccus sp. SDUM812003]|uniref:type II CAAX endopeptidase family protein n=1 Tax=Pelagicoccus sp. SDUM812003 TaxID=3041267 RepID=UPI00280EA034|nr:type II CAAX endopeptidase family protein [Pelagicoccus sp. SDUM812003]MDQ8203698.1 type II CAAX endopeptidase family protein [Pelagicoccus sp. SDUM812003]
MDVFSMIADSTEQKLTDAAANALPRWNIGAADFGIFIALLFSSMVVVSALAAKIAHWAVGPTEEGSDPPLIVFLAGNLGTQLGMVAAFAAFILITRHQHQESASRPSQVKSVRRSALIGLKWLAISYPVMIGVNLIWKVVLQGLGFEQVTQDPIRLVQEGGSLAERTMIYTMIVLVAPVCEELVFRGAIFRFLHHRFPLTAATAISAALFALIHFNLYSFAPLFVIGVTLALAYRESGSLLSAVVLHAVFNTINLFIILLFPDVT